MKKLAELEPVMIEAFAVFQMMRTLGFPSDDIFFCHQALEDPRKQEGKKGHVFVRLKRGVITADFVVGQWDHPVPDFMPAFKEMCAVAKTATKEECKAVGEKTIAWRDRAAVVAALALHGIGIPKAMHA